MGTSDFAMGAGHGSAPMHDFRISPKPPNGLAQAWSELRLPPQLKQEIGAQTGRFMHSQGLQQVPTIEEIWPHLAGSTRQAVEQYFQEYITTPVGPPEQSTGSIELPLDAIAALRQAFSSWDQPSREVFPADLPMTGAHRAGSVRRHEDWGVWEDDGNPPLPPARARSAQRQTAPRRPRQQPPPDHTTLNPHQRAVVIRGLIVIAIAVVIIVAYRYWFVDPTTLDPVLNFFGIEETR